MSDIKDDTVEQVEEALTEELEEELEKLSADDDDDDFEDPVRELDTYTVEEKCEHFDRLYDIARYVFGGICGQELDNEDINIALHELVETLGPNANDFLHEIMDEDDEDCECEECRRERECDCEDCCKERRENDDEQKLSN